MEVVGTGQIVCDDHLDYTVPHLRRPKFNVNIIHLSCMESLCYKILMYTCQEICSYAVVHYTLV
jgi:hypothetical protein